ncbi:hypothetical protein NLO98_13520 [Pseudomonas syringae]|nr:hypothetical protein [Pseudomonas syringae]
MKPPIDDNEDQPKPIIAIIIFPMAFPMKHMTVPARPNTHIRKKSPLPKPLMGPPAASGFKKITEPMIVIANAENINIPQKNSQRIREARSLLFMKVLPPPGALYYSAVDVSGSSFFKSEK